MDREFVNELGKAIDVLKSLIVPLDVIGKTVDAKAIKTKQWIETFQRF